MPNKTVERLQVTRAEKVERLQKAAIVIIARQGISQASTRSIATEAGLNLAAVHYAFKDKDDLLTSLLARLLGESLDLISGVADDCNSAEEALDAMASAYWDFAIKHPETQRVNYELAFYSLTNDEYRERAASQFVQFREHVAQILQPFLPGWSGKELMALSSTAVSTMEGLIIQWMVTGQKVTSERALALGLRALQSLVKE